MEPKNISIPVRFHTNCSYIALEQGLSANNISVERFLCRGINWPIYSILLPDLQGNTLVTEKRL